MEKGETAAVAAVREVAEEAGVKADQLEFLDVFQVREERERERERGRER